MAMHRARSFAIAGRRAALLLAIAIGASAQRSSRLRSIRPRSSVKEQQLLKELQRGSQGRVHAAGRQKAGVLEQPAGRDWRHFHEVTLRWIGAIAILGMLAVLVAVLSDPRHGADRRRALGRIIVRFNAFERFVHWMTATCFIVLALSGLNITFGKELLLPLIGPEAFTAWSQWAKYAHNYLSFPFSIGVVLMFLMWIAWQHSGRSTSSGSSRAAASSATSIRRPIASMPARR